jgi:hypothetical protein
MPSFAPAALVLATAGLATGALAQAVPTQNTSGGSDGFTGKIGKTHRFTGAISRANQATGRLSVPSTWMV